MTTLQSAKEILQKLVSFDTTSRNSNLELVAWVEEYLSLYSVKAERLYNTERSKAAILATIGSTETGGIVFSGHTDVVPVDGQQWNSSPFTMEERDGRFYGRGTCDMKGFIACCLAMVPQWAALSSKRPVHIAFSFDEEIGCRAANYIGQYITDKKWNPYLIIVGEPTSMQPVTAHKGIYSFVTKVTGREAHSSQTQIGLNAIHYASRLINKLEELAANAQNMKDERFTPPYSTIQVGVIQGGTARNIIPQQCQFEWEIRPLPQDTPPPVLQKFMAFQEVIHKELQQIDSNCGVETHPVSRVLSLKPEADESVNHLMLRLSESNSLQAVSYGTEAGILQSYGLPCFICGPGSIQQAHIPDEYVEIDQIQRCLRFMQRLQEELLEL